MSGFITLISDPLFGDYYACSNCNMLIALPSHVLPDLPVNVQAEGISFSSGDVHVSTKDSGMVERINGRTITTVYCRVCGSSDQNLIIKSPPPSPVKDQEMSGCIIFQKSHPEYGDCYICSNCDTCIASPSHVLPDLPVNVQVEGISFSSGDVNVSTKDSGMVERINGRTITTVYCAICDWILGSKFIKVAAGDERPIVGECVLKRVIQSPLPSPVKDQNILGFVIQKSRPDFGDCYVCSNCDTRIALLSHVLPDLPVNVQVEGISFSSGDVYVSTKDSGMVKRINGRTITTVYCAICDWILGSKFIKVAAGDERPIVGECVLKRVVQSPPPSPVEDQKMSGFVIQKSQPDFGEGHDNDICTYFYVHTCTNCLRGKIPCIDCLDPHSTISQSTGLRHLSSLYMKAVAGRIYAADDTEIGDLAVGGDLASEQSRGTCLTCNREVEWANFPCMCPAWCRLCMYRVELQVEKVENLDLKCAFCERSIEQFANIYMKILPKVSKQEQKKAVRSKSKMKREERRLSKLNSCSQWDQELGKERTSRN